MMSPMGIGAAQRVLRDVCGDAGCSIPPPAPGTLPIPPSNRGDERCRAVLLSMKVVCKHPTVCTMWIHGISRVHSVWRISRAHAGFVGERERDRV